ncbi:MAG: hypothetical protein IPK03_13885 [Bacteroidetes bacterium]|nr:hypothetical protein [Bacteroidota bacterium]
MMEQDGGNYFETVKAFETFWKSRTMPKMIEEEHMADGPEKANKEIRKMSKRAVKNRDFNQEMIYQIKRYNRWKREMEPYVQEDGRILTMDERLKLWREQKTETQADK